MGWKQVFLYAKSALDKHAASSADAAPPADAGLPMGARVGSFVRLQMSPFIRAAADGSLVSAPSQPDAVIVAISRVRLNMDGKLHRFYLDKGDADDASERFIQVFSTEAGDVQEILYCQRLTRIIPQTEEEQDAFTGANGAGLGEKTYTLWRGQLAGLGFKSDLLDSVYASNEGLEFTRDVGDSDDFLAPFEGVETRIDDTQGETGLKQSVHFMPYVREFGSSREYLLISTEVVQSQDGDALRRAIHVDLMVGLPLDKERIEVQ